MVAHVNTVSLSGIDVKDVDVQVSLAPGIPAFNIVGLPDKAVGESKERVRAALESLGISLPPKRITVNLAPADLMKEGNHYDLPIALGLLASLDVLPSDALSSYLAVGELTLDGHLNRVSGVLPSALSAQSKGWGVICPEVCGGEAAWAGGCEVLAPKNLLTLINHFKGTQVLTPPEARIEELTRSTLDFKDIKGQESAKRAMEIAAAGGHNILLIGPPGAGKSMMAARMVDLLPPMSPQEALETTMIHSVGGMLEKGILLRKRPFRSPHHSASLPSLVGGGTKAKPGEISLAHNGVLFLDELPEFARTTLESLRQPMEAREVHVSRANHHVVYPANFQLIAAMNPCRCGYVSDPHQACGRAPKCASDYQAKLSGPLLDRIDIHVEVSDVSPTDLSLPPSHEGTDEIAERVARARDIQNARYAALDHVSTNADVDGSLLEEACALSNVDHIYFAQAAEQLRLSARGYHRMLRVARTIADLDGAESPTRSHLNEALSYRRLIIRD